MLLLRLFCFAPQNKNANILSSNCRSFCQNFQWMLVSKETRTRFNSYSSDDPLTNPDYVQCQERIILLLKSVNNVKRINDYSWKAYYNIKYTECIVKCGEGDVECLSSCLREYDENLKTCPCQLGCPSGCPCPNYECPTTTRNSNFDSIFVF